MRELIRCFILLTTSILILVYSYRLESNETSSKAPTQNDYIKQLEEIKNQVNNDPLNSRSTIDKLKQELGKSKNIANLTLFNLDCGQRIMLGQAQEALDIASQGLALFSDFAKAPYYGHLLICFGVANELLGIIKLATQTYDQAIELAEQLQDPGLLTYAYRARGDINAYHGTVQNALEDLQEAYRVAESNQDAFNLLRAKNSLANLYSY